MKVCPNCGAQIDDNAVFCGNCGFQIPAAASQPQQPQYQYQQQPQYQYQPQPAIDPTDHTSEFDPKDISDNKVISMVVYLLSFVGVIIGLLAAHDSPYAGFNVRQSLKITVLETLLGLITLVLVWTIIVPFAACIAYIVLLVVRIICFVNICKGKAKEPPIVANFSFLK